MAAAPVLSVVVLVVSDTTRSRYDTELLEGTLEALARQVDSPPLEIIVPYIAPLHDIPGLERRYPQVRFVPVSGVERDPAVSGREHHDELRARGISLATGGIVGLLEDHGRPAPHWAASMIEAHRGPWAGAGGAIENGIDRPLNWAVYFCDFGKYQNPLTEGEADFASDANSSYKRAALESIWHVWQASFREPLVNGELRSRGYRLAHAPDAVMYQHRSGLRLGDAIKERFIWGRSFGMLRGLSLGAPARLAYAAASVLVPPLLTFRIGRRAISKRRSAPLLKALPLLVPLTIAWACGEFAGYVTARGAAAAAGKVRAHEAPGVNS